MRISKEDVINFYLNKTIGDRLRFQRKLHDLTVASVSERLDITNGYYSTMERNEKTPSLGICIKICELFKISLDYLICGIDTKKYSEFDTEYIANIISNISSEQKGILAELAIFFNSNKLSKNQVEFISISIKNIIDFLSV